MKDDAERWIDGCRWALGSFEAAVRIGVVRDARVYWEPTAACVLADQRPKGPPSLLETMHGPQSMYVGEAEAESTPLLYYRSRADKRYGRKFSGSGAEWDKFKENRLEDEQRTFDTHKNSLWKETWPASMPNC